MSYSIQTGNRFSAFIAPQPKAKALQQPKVEKKKQEKKSAEKPKPKPKPEVGGTDDGFTPVVDKRERRKPKKETGQTRKRNFDRHVPGTGRGKEVKRRGQGKGNWGNPVEAGVEDAQERLNRPRRNKNRVRKPKAEKKPEKKEEKPEEPKEPTEEDKLRQEEQEKRRLEEEEEKKKLTLDQYLKKQQSQRPKVKKNRSRRAGEGEQAADAAKFQAVTKPSEDEVTVVQLKKKEGPKSHNKKTKKEKKLDVNDFLKDAPKPKGGNKGGRKPAAPRNDRRRKAPAPQSQPNLKDESSFPSLG